MKDANESPIRLLLAERHQERLTAHTESFRAHEPLEENAAFTRDYIVHGDGRYVDGAVHVNTSESHDRYATVALAASTRASIDGLKPHFRAIQLRCEIIRKTGEEALILETAL